MALRLGELLINEKLLSQAQLEEALQAQVIFGGRPLREVAHGGDFGPLKVYFAEQADAGMELIGQLAEAAILTPGLMTDEIVSQGFHLVGKGGKVVLTGLNKIMEPTIQLPGTLMTLFRKQLRGSLFGDCNPTTDIPKILGLYQSGDLKLDEIITRTYTIDQVNEGYDDLLERIMRFGLAYQAAWRQS